MFYTVIVSTKMDLGYRIVKIANRKGLSGAVAPDNLLLKIFLAENEQKLLHQDVQSDSSFAEKFSTFLIQTKAAYCCEAGLGVGR